MSHKIPVTFIPSESGAGFTITTDAGSVSVSGSVFLLGAGICTTSASASSVFIAGSAGGSSSLLFVCNAGTASPTNTILQITTPSTSQQFLKTTATGNTVYFNSELVSVSAGGTGLSSLTQNNLLLGEGTAPVGFLPFGTDGQTLLAATGGAPVFGTITSSGKSILFTPGPNSLNIEINPNSSSFFNMLPVNQGGTGLSLLTVYGVLIGEGTLPIHVSPPGTDGQAFIASSLGDPFFSTIASPLGTLTFTFSPNALNIEVNFFSNSYSLPVGSGGTGNTLLTAFGVLIGEGSLPLHTTAAGTDGQLLIASTGNDPQFHTVTSTGGSIVFTAGPNTLNMEISDAGLTFSQPLPVSLGSTGRSFLTAYGVLIGEGSLPVNVTEAGTDGQIFLASSIGDPAFATLSSTGGTVTFSLGPNSLNLDVNLFGSTFFNPIPVNNGGLGRTIFTTYGVVIGEGSLPVDVSPPGTNGQVFLAASLADPAFATLSSTGGTITFSFGPNSLNLDVNLFGSTFFTLIPVSNGGFDQTILTTYGVVIGEGSLPVNVTAPGTNGQTLISATSADPAFATITSTGNTILFTADYNSLNADINWSGIPNFNPVPVGSGSTGQTLLTSFGVLIGEGSLGVDVTAAGTDGQVFVGATGADPAFTTLSSNTNTINFTEGPRGLNIEAGNSTGIIIDANTGTAFPVLETLSILGGDSVFTVGSNSTVTIQVNLASGSFFNPLPPGTGSTGRTVLTTHGVLIGEGSLPVNVTAPGTNGQTLLASSTGDPKFSTLTSSGGTLTFTFGPHSLNIEVNWRSGSFFIGLPISNGGTGRTVLTTYGVLIGEGSLPIDVSPAGTNGQILLASSTGDPFFATITSSGNTLSFTFGVNQLNMNVNWSALFNPLPVIYGGTGQTALTAHGVLIGEGTAGIHGASAGTNGQVLLGSSTGDPFFATITSTGNTLTFTFGPNSLNVDLIWTSLTLFNPLQPGSGGTGVTVLTTHGVLLGEGSLAVHVSAPGTNGQLFIASSTGDPKFSTVTSTGNTMTFTFGPNSLNMEVIWKGKTFFTPIQINNGGTGRTVLTAHGVLIGEGSLPVHVAAVGTNGQALLASSIGDPKFSTITSTGNTITFTFGPDSLNMDMVIAGKTYFNPLLVVSGGTGRTVLTTYGVLLGEGSSRINVTAAGTNGQALLGSSTGDPVFWTITSTGNTLTFTFGPNSLNIDIALTSNTLYFPWPVSLGGTSNTSEAPYLVICGGTTSTSALQTVPEAGSPGFILTSNGPGTLPSFKGNGITQLNVVTFSSSGTYIPSTGMQYCTVECVGGGGGSGGMDGNIANEASGGGGGGGYAIKTFSYVSVSPQQSVTVGSGGLAGSATGGDGGAGGTSSFGFLLAATGGLGGAGVVSSSLHTNPNPPGGTGGQGISGDLNIAGQNGISGWFQSAIIAEGSPIFGGGGGCSHFGGGGAGGVLCPFNNPPLIISPGGNGTFVGGGAGGPAGQGLSTGVSGSSGGAGIVIITEYL